MQSNLHSECCYKQLFLNEERKSSILRHGDFATVKKLSPQKFDNSRERRARRPRPRRKESRLKKRKEESGAHDHSFARSENFCARKSCSRIISLTSEGRGMLYILQLSLLCLPQLIDHATSSLPNFHKHRESHIV